ncbi:MAG: hypothetical protein FD172_807 [Methylocystaceae bacterium]|nr:MAG: hypothetical protein FD172_807 [Methylocystaceae bacterium]
MPFSLPLAAAIYLTIWWIVLFAVLPLGVRSSEEADEDLPEGALEKSRDHDRRLGCPLQPAGAFRQGDGVRRARPPGVDRPAARR